MRFVALTFCLLCALTTPAWSQLPTPNATVTGSFGEDEDSRPRDSDNRVRDDNGMYYGAETDGEYESLSTAIDDLQQFGNGGTILINSILSPVTPAFALETLTKPFTIRGIDGANYINIELGVVNTTLTLDNLNIGNGESSGSAVRMNNSEITATNCVFNRHGITIDEGALNTVTITDCEFIDPFPNGLTGFGEQLDVTVSNTTFRDTTTFAKALAILPTLGVADVDVRDCTFENFYMGIDDRRRRGEGTYHNLYMNNIFWVGLNLEWTSTEMPFDDATTRVTRSTFENVAFQGLHYHGMKNITVLECTAKGCGSVDAWEDDGAGFGGHFDGGNTTYEDCFSQENAGHGFFFDDKATDITIKRSRIENNGRSGIHAQHMSFLRVQERNLISGNERDGITLINVDNWTIQENNIGVNQFSVAAQPNKQHGVSMINIGHGMLGNRNDETDKGNLISGNIGNGVRIENVNSSLSDEIVIAGNWIGTDRGGSERIPNGEGIHIEITNDASGLIRIGGENPAIAQQTSGSLGNGNIISGNSFAGIFISREDTVNSNLNVEIQGNLIGVDGTGTRALRNGLNGIYCNNLAGGTFRIGAEQQASRRNIISGNTLNGIHTESSDNPWIHSNAIGVGIDFETPIPNEGNGINLTDGTQRAHIENNWIQYNKEHGVRVHGELTRQNRITQNRIHANGKKGISLEDGANGGIEAPVLRHHFLPGDSDTLEGFTDVSNPTIEVFVDPVLGTDQEGYWGQGKEYISSPGLLPESNRFVTFLNPTEEGFRTATVTDENGNTSEFSSIASARVIQTVHPDNDDYRDEDPLLVANKKTVVRVYTHNGVSQTQVPITGTLTVEQTGEQVTPLPQTHSMAPFGFYGGSDQRQQRYMAQDSLNFYLDRGATGLVDLSLTLNDGTHDRAEIDLGDYLFRQSLDPMNLLCILLSSPPSALGTGVPPNEARVAEAAMYLMSVYPIDNVAFRNNLSFVFIPPNTPAVGTDGPPHPFFAKVALISAYELFRAGYRYSLMGTPPQFCSVFISRTIGLTPPSDPDKVYGFSLPNSLQRTVLAVDSRRRNHSGPIIAHEIGHIRPFFMGDTYDDPSLEKNVNPLLSGARHNRFGNVVPEEDFGFDPSGNARLDLALGSRGRPPGPGIAFSVNDFMGNHEFAWVDAPTNRHLFRSLGATGVPTGQVEPEPEPVSTLTFSGIVSLNGESTLGAVRQDFTPFPTLPPTLQTGYSIQLLDQAGSVLNQSILPVSFVGEALGENETSAESFGRMEEGEESPFVVSLENHEDAHEVVLLQGDTILVSSARSSAAPQAAITIPEFPDNTATGTFEISWDVDDSDTPTESCFADLYFAHTDGDLRVPLLMDATNQDSFVVDMSRMPGGEESRFELVINDGWNETIVVSDSFQTLDCVPSIAICSPSAENPTVFSDTAITLLGSAYDPEDRLLGGDQLLWYLDDAEEPFATGFNPTVMIDEGSHTLTLVAIDSAGNEVQTSLDIDASPLDEETWLRLWDMHH